LVELLVVLALLSLMVVAASQLVIHSIQLLGATGRSVRNPVLVHVTNRLRNDVQEAAGACGLGLGIDDVHGSAAGAHVDVDALEVQVAKVVYVAREESLLDHPPLPHHHECSPSL